MLVLLVKVVVLSPYLCGRRQMQVLLQVLAVVQRDLQERQFVVREEDSPETVREIELKNVPIVPRPRPDTRQASASLMRDMQTGYCSIYLGGGLVNWPPADFTRTAAATTTAAGSTATATPSGPASCAVRWSTRAVGLSGSTRYR